jgi:hypothetical protein
MTDFAEGISVMIIIAITLVFVEYLRRRYILWKRSRLRGDRHKGGSDYRF